MCDGVKSGMKPPLRLVEKYFGASWRPGPGVSEIELMSPLCRPDFL